MSNLYLNYLLIAKGIPRKIVADRNAENVNIGGSQRFFRRNHSGDSSGYQNFQFGKSITNQRIESFWPYTSLMYKLLDSFFQGNCARGNIL